jgi:cell surface protein SprA
LRNPKLYILALGVCLLFYGLLTTAAPKDDTYYPDDTNIPEDTIPEKKVKGKRPTYEEKDRPGDEFSNKTSESPLLLDKPSNVETDVTLDTSGTFFIIEEKVGDNDYRPASTMSYEEYMKYQDRKYIKNYWQNKSGDSSGLRARKDPKAGPLSLKIPVKGLEGPFGSDFVDIKPNGLVTLDFGYKHQHTYNPQVPKRQQSQGSFDFDNQIQLNVVGKIGEKLKMTVNWDTKATFEFQNNFKIEYTGYEHDILQKIEVGQVSMPINSSLIQGAQNLFGVKTKMQFGRMTMTTVVATQRGKTESVTAQGGSTSRTFELKGDNYDDYRHFFIGHFFRDNYERSLRNLPIVTSGAKVTQVDVYVTNSNNTTINTRDMVAFLDLGETQPHAYNQTLVFNSFYKVNDNKANDMYDKFQNDVKNPLTLSDNITLQGYVKGTEFEVLNNARKLKPEEFTFNPDLGYISLVTPLRSYEVLAVAYQYAYQGETHVVGDASGIIQNADSNSALILKLLKPSSIKTRLNSWDLMMKNIYSLGATQISRDNFQFRVIYRDDISGADIPNLQEGVATKNVPIVRLLNADQLNLNSDPYPDGNFDFVEGVTIDSRNGRVIFPVLEPFGSDLQKKFDPNTETDLINKYVFFELYDSTKSDAGQIASKNKYYLRGRFQSSASNEIPLQGAINLAQGSVKVTAGSRTLVENQDYTVDYSQGKVKILNEGVLASGQEIKISYEKQDLFNVRQKSFYGSRFDYRVNRDINIGGTILHQNERPTLTRVNIGDEPSSNTLWGVDANIKKESRFLTKVLDKLPLYQTKVPSMITASGEVANLLPGHNKALDKNGKNGAAFLDDFEASETPYDFVRSPTRWKLASTPLAFAESAQSNRKNGERRASLSWYNIDQSFYTTGSSNDLQKNLPDEGITNHYERAVLPQEVFPNLNKSQVQTNQVTLDLSFFPNQRGPYNYNTATTINGNKEIIPSPTSNWAGIMRNITNDVDFDNSNIQYIEFWMLNPYIAPAGGRTDIEGTPFNLNNKGKLYFNLGSISEDVLKDSRLEYENGLPVAQETTTSNTSWGIVSNQQPLTNAFSSQTDARDKQDVGLDGLNDVDEKNFPGVPPVIKQTADPAGDNFKYYDEPIPSIIDRYRKFNGVDKNSPVNSSSSNYTNPDNEDLNQDNTLNTLDEYYEYVVDIDNSTMVQGINKYIVGHVDAVKNGDNVQWLQFRIPIRTPDNTVGAISGFKTIRFLRMYMTGFSDPVVLRFAQLQLVANQWRVYQPDDINQTGFGGANEPDDAQLIVSTVNIEENGQSGSANSSPYVLPPGTSRDQDPVSSTQRSINEQSLRLTVNDLDNMNARGAYKNVSFDLLNYRRLNMFLHAETPDPNTHDGDMTAFLRLGTDITQNYYEIEVPLYFSAPGVSDDNEVWKNQNQIDLAIQTLIDVKLERNRLTSNKTTPYSKTVDGKKINVVGNPDISTVVVSMLGIRNPATNSLTGSSADVSPKSASIWADELRVTDFENKAAWATTANVNAKLADLANVTGSMKYTTVGFGGLDQKISQRQRMNTLSYGTSGSFTLDKFIPEKAGIKLPMYLSYDRTIISPQYNPLDPDVKMSKYTKEERDTIKKLVQDITTRKAINFTNFKKIKTKKDAKSHFYDFSNLSFTVGYNEIKRTSFEIYEYKARYYKGAVEYNHSFKSKSLEPFKKAKFAKSKYLRLVRDVNVNPVPASFTFRNDIDRKIIKTQYYEAGPYTAPQTPLYEKSFMLTRTYALPWNITKSVNINYTATANAIVDEPGRAPGDKAYKDTLWKNFSNFGRLKSFTQGLNATYKVPLDKIPFLTWLNADVNYTSGFLWTAGPVNLRDTSGKALYLGNLANNKSDVNFTGKINLETFYNKSKFLKEINNPKPEQKGPKKPPPVDPKNPKAKDTTQVLKKPELKALKGALRMLMLVRNVMPTYGISRTTQLPGYMPTPTYIGLDAKGNYDQTAHMGEALPFIFGSQDPHFRYTAASRGWITKETELNTPYLQTKNHIFSAKTSIEPFRDFKIQVDIKKTKGSNYQEIFRVNEDTSGNPLQYRSFSPSRNGSYSISYLSILTSFTKTSGADNFNKTFETFGNNRQIILDRINDSRYIKNSQDVLVPAFLAAYSGRDARKQKLTSFPKIPLPNWNVTYSGLSRLGFFNSKFSSVMLTHGYTSTYAIGAFQSALIYGDGFIKPEFDITNGVPGDSVNKDGVIIPIYAFADVSIREQYGPLIGINLKSKGKTTYRFEYKRGRTLSLSLSNAQLREDINQDFVFGISYIKTGVKLPKFQGRSTVLKNELTVRMDVTVRDTRSYQRKMDQGSTITAGNLNFQAKPTVSYAVSQRVTMLFYFEHTRAVPRLSSSFKRNTTSFGLQIRFTLS